jgi:hypothetical protein
MKKTAGDDHRFRETMIVSVGARPVFHIPLRSTVTIL